MRRRVVLPLVLLLVPFAVRAQTVQYRSPAGVEYRSQPDSGPVARAAALVAAEPRSVERLVALGNAQAGARQFREAIETYTRALALAPEDAMLYRWRGHRLLSVREFDRAEADLRRGFALDSTNYGVLYHLGVVQMVRGRFEAAAATFARAQRVPPSARELAGSTDWRWLALARAGRLGEARRQLALAPDTVPPSYAYVRRIRMYRGDLLPSEVISGNDTEDVQRATLHYGVGSWFLVHGDTAQARRHFAQAVESGGWPAFGFILAEVELARLPARRED